MQKKNVINKLISIADNSTKNFINFDQNLHDLRLYLIFNICRFILFSSIHDYATLDISNYCLILI